MVRYIYDLDEWPEFRWNEGIINRSLAAVRHRQGRLVGRMEALGFDLRAESILATLTEDVLKSSEIEGKIFDKDTVRSSVARQLGVDIGALGRMDRDVDGVVEMMLDATQKFAEPLNAERLFSWHSALFPAGRSGMRSIVTGAWRIDRLGPMRVLSGPFGKERLHFEAPAANRLYAEMASFLNWFNAQSRSDPVLKAALAHLWFVTVHPFEDGNGRIARAIADMALARSEQSPQRFYSMSAQIRVERQAYYDILEATQKGDLDVTDWLSWFFGCLDRAVTGAEQTLGKILAKAKFWERVGQQTVSHRQRVMINSLLDGFQGKLTTSKWAALTKSSQDTALRDIADLIDRRILRRNDGGGRSTSYSLAEDGVE